MARAQIPTSPLLEGLSNDERAEVTGAGAQRQVAGGAVLFHEGEPAHALVLTLLGRFKLAQVSQGGQEVVVRFSGPGDAFGALAVLDGKVYPFTATAVIPSRVMQWTRCPAASPGPSSGSFRKASHRPRASSSPA